MRLNLKSADCRAGSNRIPTCFEQGRQILNINISVKKCILTKKFKTLILA